MATATITPKTEQPATAARAPKSAKPKAKAKSKANGKPKASEKTLPEIQRMAYQGYCIAVAFDRSLVKAQQTLEAARAKDKEGKYRWHLYLITPNKPHAKGTKQAKLAAGK